MFWLVGKVFCTEFLWEEIPLIMLLISGALVGFTIVSERLGKEESARPGRVTDESVC